MEIILLAVGTLRPAFREACDDYLRRIGRYARIRELEVREASRAPTVEAQREQEAERMLEKGPPGTALVALTWQGSAWSSTGLAAEVGRWQSAARSVTLVVGGSHGLAPSLVDRAQARWSLGPLTLPHELARVVVVEQLYRAFTILRREAYHKGRGT